MKEVKLTKHEKEVFAFIQTYRAEHKVVPTYKQISYGLGGLGTATVGRHIQSLRKAGLVHYTSKKKRTEEHKTSLHAENKPVQKVIAAVRSGVHELNRKQIEEKAYTIELMTARLPDGMEWKFLFTVNHQRGYDEYLQIRQQKQGFGHSRYAKSLFYGMFKKW